MKRFLLSCLLIACSFLGKSQAVLNELYFNPSSGEKEYIELYNSGAFDNLDCYTLLSLYDDNGTPGFYVINFPNVSLNSNSFIVLSSGFPIVLQNSIYNKGVKDFSWNDLNAIGSTGYFKQFKKNGLTYSEVAPVTTPDDILKTLPSSYDAKNITLLYRNGILINALFINGKGLTSLNGLPDLTVPGNGTCASFTAKFSTIQESQIERMTEAIGQSNGAYRTSDGKCGAWNKASSPSSNTPGVTNGASTSTSNETIAVSGNSNCTLNSDNTRNATYFVINSQTSSGAYPLTLQLYADNGSISGQLDAQDKFIDQQTITTAPPSGTPNTVYSAKIPSNYNGSILVVAKSTAGCFQTIQAISNSCATLPVTYTSFNATRKNNTVALTWETASEENNKGFYIQRNTGGDWKDVAFVFSATANGNSNANLSYAYNDANAVKGASQYRILQVDIDGKGRYSEIRSVRGLEQAAKVVVFPNPSTDKINVMFEDAQSVREVTITDIAGRVVKQYRNVTSNSLSIDNLKDGFYNIQVTDRHTGATVVEKAVMKKR